MSDQTVGGWIRGFFPRYIAVQTILWIVVLNVADLLPREGELIPRGGAWRPATGADRIQSFLWFTFCWYFGAMAVFGLSWRVAEAMYDVLFGSERSE
jgi:hypothetical protein